MLQIGPGALCLNPLLPQFPHLQMTSHSPTGPQELLAESPSSQAVRMEPLKVDPGGSQTRGVEGLRGQGRGLEEGSESGKVTECGQSRRDVWCLALAS